MKQFLLFITLASCKEPEKETVPIGSDSAAMYMYKLGYIQGADNQLRHSHGYTHFDRDKFLLDSIMAAGLLKTK